MPETQFPSGIQRMIYCQIGSFKRFFGSDPASPGGQVRKSYHDFACSHQNQKGEVAKE
jgi:hypothetical protein